MMLHFSPQPGTELPIFSSPSDHQTIVYTPGCVAGIENAQISAFSAMLAEKNAPETTLVDRIEGGCELAASAERILTAGRAALAAWDRLTSQPFSPYCLTLYAKNACNLDCVYCFSDPGSSASAPQISIPTVRAAARHVAEACRAAGRAMTVVFQGGGEPTLDLEWMKEAMAAVESAAREAEVVLARYLATNGVMSNKKAVWVADHFDLIGLSCDGPPEIHNLQRPKPGGHRSAGNVEGFAHVMREKGKKVLVRTTILPDHAARQVEIVHYLCRVIKPVSISVEPVFSHGRAEEQVQYFQRNADAFVESFFNAQAVAKFYGTRYETSCSRIEEIHGPYCHPFRSVIQLVPGDRSVGCFLTCEMLEGMPDRDGVGYYDDQADQFRIDYERISNLREKLGAIPARCCDCFNRFHCVRGCPDACGLDDYQNIDFRCQVAIQMTITKLERIVSMHARQSVWVHPIAMVTP